MAFSKMKIQQIEQLAGQSGPAMQRLGSLAQAVTLAMQETLAVIREAAALWDNGAGAVVEATPRPEQSPEGSQYSQAQWYAWLLAQGAIVAATEIPLATLATLAVVDSDGDAILDPETGQPIRPFAAALDPDALALVGQAESIKSIVWRDPQIVGVRSAK